VLVFEQRVLASCGSKISAKDLSASYLEFGTCRHRGEGNELHVTVVAKNGVAPERVLLAILKDLKEKRAA
jgi:hypothetical protein